MQTVKWVIYMNDMNTKNEKKYITELFQPLLLQIIAFSDMVRPYSIPYIALLGLLGVHVGQYSPTTVQIRLAVFIPVSIWIILLVVNDYLHRNKDRLISDRQNRFFVKHEVSSKILFSIVMGFILLLTVLGFSQNLLAGAFIFLIVIASMVYALGKDIPLFSNLIRGISGGLIILTTASFTGLTVIAFTLAIVFTGLDAIGNLFGDVRDKYRDKAGGQRTTATVFSKNVCLGIGGLGFFLILIFLYIVSIGFPLEWLLLTSIAGASVIIFSSCESIHKNYLMIKLFAVCSCLALFNNPEILLIFPISILYTIFGYKMVHHV